ncbi:hypothetical protein [Parendozoicomonas sp. Alg238-R29]|uniref:hypothetical protein n=1 Tax=Parendozoicomonas sp. Alg238-R29 TaxID=2993446 RepID=UPI00248E1BFB|nr:hypothetical protein [Parendozoicomonas sp. Alg238-R29]
MPARIFTAPSSDIEKMQCMKTLLQKQAECLRKRNMDTLPLLNDETSEPSSALQYSVAERETL